MCQCNVLRENTCRKTVENVCTYLCTFLRTEKLEELLHVLSLALVEDQLETSGKCELLQRLGLDVRLLLYVLFDFVCS